jgi:UrcA family protein
MRVRIKPQYSSLFCAALAGAGVALSAAPASAQTVEELTVVGRVSPGGEVRSLSRVVSFSDLDLRRPAARDELVRRISFTARDLCDKLGESSTSTGPIPSCKSAAMKDAMVQARQAYAMADAGVYATAMDASEQGVPASDTVAYVPPAAEAYAPEPTVTMRTVTNGPVADTPENRERYGEPLSNAGRRTAPAGN